MMSDDPRCTEIRIILACFSAGGMISILQPNSQVVFEPETASAKILEHE